MDAHEQAASGAPVATGLVITDPADRRLLVDFLTGSGYEVRAGIPSEIVFADWVRLSLIVADERAARDYGRELLALKQQATGLLLPLLILLPVTAESTPWLQAGFDDVLRMPLRKAELAARLQIYLQLRRQMQTLAEYQASEAQLHQDKNELELRVSERTGELKNANVELRRLTQKIVMTQEEERERLARELHDEIGQALTAVNFNLQAFQHLIVDPIIASRLQDSLNIIENTLRQVRDLSLDLHPAILDQLGLVAALQWYLERQAKRAGLAFEFLAEPSKMDLPANLKTTCFRLAQESLTNIMRHAGAKKVQVELRRHDTELELVIRDDGAGFDVQAARRRAAQGASLGLLGMEERVRLLDGQFHIKSLRGRGTEVQVRFPLAPAAQAKPRREREKRRPI
ncbi:MAG: sensor histidine kinase [Anaerolineae bacterium]